MNELEELPLSPLSTVEDLFLTIPLQYLVPPGANQGDFSEQARRAILAKSPQKPVSVNIEVLDPSNGYISFSTRSTVGSWMTELTFFNNSLKDKRVAVNHIWAGEFRFSHDLFVLEKTATGWADRTSGAIPAFNQNFLSSSAYPVTDWAKVKPANPKWQETGFARRCLLFTLPRTGKDILVERAHERAADLPNGGNPLKLLWHDGVFGPDNSILNDLAVLDGKYLQIRDPEPFDVFPKANDNLANRMKCVVLNDALYGQIRIGSHPAVNMHEGYLEISRFQHGALEIMIVIGNCGLDACPSEIQILEKKNGNWVNSTTLSVPAFDFDHINELYLSMPAEDRMFDRIGLSEVTIECDVQDKALVMTLKSSFSNEDPAPVLQRLELSGTRWVLPD